MLKKNYEGLDVAFVPVTGADIITASTETCKVISVQYYVGNADWSQCDTEDGEGDGEGYSYNWNRQATDD